MIANILTIAGSDSGGGAGIQADLKTIAALECYGLSVITAVTAQNTRSVRAVHPVPVDIVQEQLEAVFEDIRIDAVKIGMACSPAIIDVIVKALQRFKPAHVVIDPVMVSGAGNLLADADTIVSIRHDLLPMATVLTPNMPEAEVLLGRKFKGDLEDFAADLLTLEPRSVFLKGGHVDGRESTDVFANKERSMILNEDKIETKNTHGTGCTLSSAMAVYLAKGLPEFEAAAAAKKYVTAALRHGNDLDVGRGSGPLNHFFAHWKRGSGV